MQTLYHYRMFFDSEGKRTTGSLDKDTYYFGSFEYHDTGKQYDFFTRHIPFEKYTVNIEKETEKGYKDALGMFYKKSELDKILITNCPGKRVCCMIDYYSFSNYVSAEEIQKKFKTYILNCFNRFSIDKIILM